MQFEQAFGGRLTIHEVQIDHSLGRDIVITPWFTPEQIAFLREQTANGVVVMDFSNLHLTLTINPQREADCLPVTFEFPGLPQAFHAVNMFTAS